VTTSRSVIVGDNHKSDENNVSVELERGWWRSCVDGASCSRRLGSSVSMFRAGIRAVEGWEWRASLLRGAALERRRSWLNRPAATAVTTSLVAASLQ
jgi:hypothetical protein